MINFSTIKFLIVAACLINTFYVGKGVLHIKDTNLLRLAMVFTLAADYFLILTCNHMLGVLLFCIVQIIYNVRYSNLKNVQAQIMAGLSIFIISYLIFNTELIIAVGLMYATLFTFSLVSAFFAYKKYPKPNNVLIVVGMVLFALCDINVALYGLNMYSPYVYFSATSLKIMFTLIWFFYLPSQILLSLSGRSYSNFAYKLQK